jgi:hypothetical protein
MPGLRILSHELPVAAIPVVAIIGVVLLNLGGSIRRRPAHRLEDREGTDRCKIRRRREIRERRQVWN